MKNGFQMEELYQCFANLPFLVICVASLKMFQLIIEPHKHTRLNQISNKTAFVVFASQVHLYFSAKLQW